MNTLYENKACSLLGLPVELRLYIYESVLCSTPKKQQHHRISLFDPSPPKDNTLLLICRQISNEARTIHRQVQQNYWRQGSFSIPIDCESDLKIDKICQKIEELKIDDEDLALVSDVTVVCKSWQELSQIMMRRRMTGKTTKGDLVALTKDFAQNFDRLLMEQWWNDLMG